MITNIRVFFSESMKDKEKVNGKLLQHYMIYTKNKMAVTVKRLLLGTSIPEPSFFSIFCIERLRNCNQLNVTKKSNYKQT